MNNTREFKACPFCRSRAAMIKELNDKIASLEARVPVVCECVRDRRIGGRRHFGADYLCATCKGNGATWKDGEI